MQFVKYHATGNDYLVARRWPAHRHWSTDVIRRICDRRIGCGADGILVPVLSDKPHRSVRIFNPDGSEAEKSGNGLRILARYFWDEHLVQADPFPIMTAGGLVHCQVLDGGKGVRVEMGRIAFANDKHMETVESNDNLTEIIMVQDRPFQVTPVSLGNPHCVLVLPSIDSEFARRWGPAIEQHVRFPHRVNVQFVQILSRGSLRLEIWERGAGYTLSSGSSSCAAAAVTHRMGLTDRDVTVMMPGGNVEVQLRDDGRAVLTGPVVRIGEMVVDPECLSDLL